MIFILDRTVDLEPPTKKPMKFPKILDGIFYTVVSNNDGNIEAKCEECGQIKKGNVSSTGNFKSHYKKYKEKFDELEKYLKATDNITEITIKQPSIRDMLPAIPQEKVFKLNKSEF